MKLFMQSFSNAVWSEWSSFHHMFKVMLSSSAHFFFLKRHNRFTLKSDIGQILGIFWRTKWGKKKKIWAQHLNLSTKACGVTVTRTLDCLESITTRKAISWYFCLPPGCLGLFCVWTEYRIKCSIGFYFFLLVSRGLTMACIFKKPPFSFRFS